MVSFHTRQALCNYLEAFKTGNVTIPPAPALTALSERLDSSTKRAFDKLCDTFRTSPEYDIGLASLTQQPRLAGKFSPKKIILQGAESFEQMVILNDWFDTHAMRKDHSFFFAKGEDDYYHVSIKRPHETLLHCVLGATRGDRKAPKYSDLTEKDPWQNPNYSRFLHPLECLEMVRQPGFIGATVLKGNSYELDAHPQIDQNWRYGLDKACVEAPNQKKNTPKKLQSAGLNLAAMIELMADMSDPLATEADICYPIRIAEYGDSGYKDDADFQVSVGNILKAVKTDVEDQNSEPLDQLMFRLMAAKIGPPKSAPFADAIVNYLIPDLV